MIAWVDTVIQGLLLGGLYTLFALGLSLTFGVMRLVNVAHGDFIVLSAFVVLVFSQGLGISLLAAAVLCVPLMFAVGYAIQRFMLNATIGAGVLPPLLVTFGLSMIIQNALLRIFSADPRALRLGGFETESFNIGGGIAVGYFPFLVLVVAIVLTACLEFLFRGTGIGRAFRAASDDPEITRLMGIDDRHVYALAFGLACAIAAIAAVFYGVRTTFSAGDGPDRLLFAFEAVIIGGLGSFWGTLAGGALLGVAQAIGFRLNPGWGILFGHIAFLAVLLVRPSGLFPKTK